MSKTRSSRSKHIRPILGVTLISLVMCGLLFPVVVTGVAQVALPWQANGEIVRSSGRAVGSNLVAENFTSPIFFQPRNDSASGVDPDITVQDAYDQIPTISNATGIAQSELKQIVDENIPFVAQVFGVPYVNVLQVNLALISTFPQYSAYR